MIKKQEHYVEYCKELGLDPKDSNNIYKFMEDDEVYYSDDAGEMFIDRNCEMNHYKDNLYYHESESVNEWSIKDDLVDVTFYKKLKNR